MVYTKRIMLVLLKCSLVLAIPKCEVPSVHNEMALRDVVT